MLACTRCGLAARHACAACGAPYCGPACQRADWPRHGAQPVPRDADSSSSDDADDDAANYDAGAEYVGKAVGVTGAGAEALAVQLAVAIEGVRACDLWAEVLGAQSLEELADKNLLGYNNVVELLRDGLAKSADASRDPSALAKRLAPARQPAAPRGAAAVVGLVVRLAAQLRAVGKPPSKVRALVRAMSARADRRRPLEALAAALLVKRNSCGLDQLDQSACAGPTACARRV